MIDEAWDGLLTRAPRQLSLPDVNRPRSPPVRPIRERVRAVHQTLRIIEGYCDHLKLYGSLESADSAWYAYVKPGEAGEESRAASWERGSIGRTDWNWPLPAIQHRRLVTACPNCWEIFRKRPGTPCPECGDPHELKRMLENEQTMAEASRHVLVPYVGQDLEKEEEAFDSAMLNYMADNFDNELGEQCRQMGYGTNRED